MSGFILNVDCPDTIGIVHAVSDLFYSKKLSVIEASEFSDQDKNRFFARWHVKPQSSGETISLTELEAEFASIADRFSMNWKIFSDAVKPRVLIAVSQHGHCLNDLLYRWKEESDTFPAEIVGVVSNHEVFRDKTEWHGLPFYYLPITKETKPQQEQQILDLIDKHDADLLVLARYMQILSDDMCQKLDGRAINIHHSFLPSFKGAKPYHQAHSRGVKISGATAHYVTSDLDEGPIIEQDVQRHEHSHNSDKMARLGRNVEQIVLARAVYWHCQHRIIMDGHRTVIFK